MREDSSVSTYTVIAASTWVVTGLLLLAAWLAWAVGDDSTHLAILIAETACAASAVAATMQVRCYSAKVCSQLRVMRAEIRNGQEPPRVRSL